MSVASLGCYPPGMSQVAPGSKRLCCLMQPQLPLTCVPPAQAPGAGSKAPSWRRVQGTVRSNSEELVLDGSNLQV